VDQKGVLLEIDSSATDLMDFRSKRTKRTGFGGKRERDAEREKGTE
jgi:hypothetical protein